MEQNRRVTRTLLFLALLCVFCGDRSIPQSVPKKSFEEQVIRLLLQLKQRMIGMENQIIANRNAIELITVAPQFVNNDDVLTNLKFSLPISSIDELMEMEHLLKSTEECKLNLFKVLASVGGCKLRPTIFTIVRKVITKDVALLFSLKGRKHKKPFVDLELYKVFIDVEAYIDEFGYSSNFSSYPYFEFNVPRNVTTTVGQTAFLHCRVEQLGDKAVSWIRKRDLHILTAGILTYTSDQRFQVIRPDKSDNWTLQIKFPQLRDSGIYECQVNTEPKMSLAYRLNVIEAKARVLGPGDLHVKAGSSVTLVCVINQGPHDLGTVFWYLGANMLEVTSVHPNEADPTARLSIQNHWSDGLTSRLHISSAMLSDSGNYSCVPTLASPASVNVHVINGEHPAAMQHGNKNTAPLSLSLHCTLVYSISVFIIKHIR